MRGLVIGAAWHHRGFEWGEPPPGETPRTETTPVKIVYEGFLEPIDLRRWLLYWDKFAIPGGTHGLSRLCPDADFLSQAGLLELRRSSDRRPQEWDEKRRLFLDLEDDEPGCWSIASEGKGSAAQPETDNRALLIRLLDTVPVPEREIPLVDVLNFREKRRDEMLAMRIELERIYQRVLASPDIALAAQTEFDALGRALRDVTAVCREEGWKIRFAGLEAKISWEVGFKDLLVGAGAGFAIGGVTGSIVGTAAGFMPKIEVSTGLGLDGAHKSDRPFEYVALAAREL
jgi:hypothetical protein